MKIIAITNKKGGVGKTTTALCTAACLGRHGFHVLAIDLDAQGNFSQASAAQENTAGTMDFLRGEPLEAVVQRGSKYDFITADKRLSKADTEFDGIGREHILQKALSRVTGYDYIILDTPPSMGLLTLNAFVAADTAVICCQADSFSVNGLDEVAKNLDLVKEYYNDRLTIAGILLTRFDARTNIAKDVANIFVEKAKELHTRLFSTYIRDNVAVKGAQMQHCDIYTYDENCHAASDYTDFTKELFTLLEGESKAWPESSPQQKDKNSPRISIPRAKRQKSPRRHGRI